MRTKPVWKDYTLYDSNRTTFHKRQNCGGRKKMGGCQGWNGGQGGAAGTEDLQGSDTAPCDTGVDTGHHICVKTSTWTHRNSAAVNIKLL